MRLFTDVLDRLRPRLTAHQLNTFDRYARLIIEANPAAALTSVGGREAIYQRHFLESMALLRLLDGLGLVESPVIDIGSGAGIPGIPIKIARPDLHLTLLEATGKKAAFLQSAAEGLGLEDLGVVCARAEEASHDPLHRETYRLALARAVAPLPVLLELALPFVEPGGVLAAPKGSAAQREMRESAHALKTLGGQIEHTAPLEPASGGPQQTVIVVRKMRRTPEQYSRRPGMPKKRPL